MPRTSFPTKKFPYQLRSHVPSLLFDTIWTSKRYLKVDVFKLWLAFPHPHPDMITQFYKLTFWLVLHVMQASQALSSECSYPFVPPSHPKFNPPRQLFDSILKYMKVHIISHPPYCHDSCLDYWTGFLIGFLTSTLFPFKPISVPQPE